MQNESTVKETNVFWLKIKRISLTIAAFALCMFFYFAYESEPAGSDDESTYALYSAFFGIWGAYLLSGIFGADKSIKKIFTNILALSYLLAKFIYKSFMWILLAGLIIWLIVALGPLWIIAILLLLIFFAIIKI